MIEVIFARRLLAISRHRDFPTEPTSRADIPSPGGQGEKKCMRVGKLPHRSIILTLRVTSASSIFLEAVGVPFR